MPVPDRPRPLADLRQELRALRARALTLGIWSSIEFDVGDTIRAIVALLGGVVSYDEPAPVVCVERELLDRLRAVRDEFEAHALACTDRRTGIALRTACFAVARAVVNLVDDLAVLHAEIAARDAA